MKITKTQLRRIIKEELSKTINEDNTPDQQMAKDKVEEVAILFADMYEGLPNNESKKLFGEYLKANVESHIESWQKQRYEDENPEHWRSTPGLPEELP